MLTTFSFDDVTKWYKHIDYLQLVFNIIYHCNIGSTLFKATLEIPMQRKFSLDLKELVDAGAKSISGTSERRTIQEKNCVSYNLYTGLSQNYKVRNSVAIKMVHLGPGLKLRFYFIGPHEVKLLNTRHTYDVTQVDVHEYLSVCLCV